MICGDKVLNNPFTMWMVRNVDKSVTYCSDFVVVYGNWADFRYPDLGL